MVEMPWLESHVGSISACIEYANRLVWNMSFFHAEDGKWVAKSGETIIYSADTKEALDSFLYGIGLAYSGIPEDLLAKLEVDLKGRFV